MVDLCYGESCDVDGAHCASGHHHLSKLFYHLLIVKGRFCRFWTKVFRFTGLTGNPPVTRQPRSLGSRCHFDFSGSRCHFVFSGSRCHVDFCGARCHFPPFVDLDFGGQLVAFVYLRSLGLLCYLLFSLFLCLCLAFIACVLSYLLSLFKWRRKGLSPPNVSLPGCARIVTCCMLCVDYKPEVAGGCRISRLDGGVKSGTCSKLQTGWTGWSCLPDPGSGKPTAIYDSIP